MPYVLRRGDLALTKTQLVLSPPMVGEAQKTLFGEAQKTLSGFESLAVQLLLPCAPNRVIKGRVYDTLSMER